ncbi:MAG TPA: type II 3-dehydroquinate dehydratase [Bryobacteraceae bacterium]|nr:type II 3-dehydroquinate dehydratase [Bryobacteraceae bacterium]
MRFPLRRAMTLSSILLLAATPVFTQTAAHEMTKHRLRILVLNGPNMNLLGRRQPEIYGRTTLAEIESEMKKLASDLDVEVLFFQSNSEGALIDAFHQHIDDVDGAIINPAGYSQHSIAIHDAIKAMPFPTVEVHLSNIASRDALHQADVIMPAARGAVIGMGPQGYQIALRGLVAILREGKTP